jgi:hypothetical protein
VIGVFACPLGWHYAQFETIDACYLPRAGDTLITKLGVLSQCMLKHIGIHERDIQ